MLRGNLQSRRVRAALQRMGWAVVSSSGSHTVLEKADIPPLVLPPGHPTVRATTALTAIRRAGEDVARFEQEC